MAFPCCEGVLFVFLQTGRDEGPVAPLPTSHTQARSGTRGCSPSGSCRRHNAPPAGHATAAAWHEASHAWYWTPFCFSCFVSFFPRNGHFTLRFLCLFQVSMVPLLRACQAICLEECLRMVRVLLWCHPSREALTWAWGRLPCLQLDATEAAKQPPH